MSRKWVIGAILATALVIHVAARAHQGQAHKMMGTVSSVEGNHVVVKTTDGKTVMVMLDSKTTITRGKTKLDATALKVGERVVVEGTEDKDMVTAKIVKLGQLAATAKM